MAEIKLLLADDHEIVREGLRALLKAYRDCEIVGEAADGRQAVALVKELKPDIVILVISLGLRFPWLLHRPSSATFSSPISALNQSISGEPIGRPRSSR